MSANVFCQNFYKDIQYHIADYHKQGFLGNNESDNNQWKEILSKNLYSAYAPKFADQAMYVFNGLEWETADLNVIRNEVKILKNSSYLQQGSQVAIKFKEIDSILKKYDEIADFISLCNNFSYSPDGMSDGFPDVSDKIQRSRAYLSNSLDNSYVNNCARLKDGLREIPKKLFDEHVNYLHKKNPTKFRKLQQIQLSSRLFQWNFHTVEESN